MLQQYNLTYFTSSDFSDAAAIRMAESISGSSEKGSSCSVVRRFPWATGPLGRDSAVNTALKRVTTSKAR